MSPNVKTAKSAKTAKKVVMTSPHNQLTGEAQSPARWWAGYYFYTD